VPTLPEADASKDEWRAWAHARRASMDWEELSRRVVDELQSWMRPDSYRTALVYLPLADEIDLRRLLEEDRETRFVATRTPERGGELSVHELGGPLEVHRFGFLQPHATAPRVGPDAIDVLLVPGLVFDLYGNRLGHGAGYFDRLLATTRAGAKLVGIVPAALVVDRLPVEPHDIPMGYLATEEGVIETA
jgi:5-formyltetrahydrofolate cyclo-ligase